MIDYAEIFPNCIITEVEDKSPEWLENRKKGIGGSDAGVVMEVNPFKRKHELWLEKTGREVTQFTGNEATIRGDRYEPKLIGMFEAKHPAYKMIDTKHISLANKDYPFIAVSLDGAFIDENGVPGTLEIKTAMIQNGNMLEEWNGGIPQSYYCQVLHQLLVTGFQVAKLYVWLDTPFWDEEKLREYTFYADECRDDMKILKEAEIEFWHMVENDKEPNLI